MDTLVIESDEALSLARERADRDGTSIDEAVLKSLRASLSQVTPRGRPPPQPLRVPSPDELTPEQRADYEAMQVLVREASHHIVPGATSDHSDMYDKYGLPV